MRIITARYGYIRIVQDNITAFSATVFIVVHRKNTSRVVVFRVYRRIAVRPARRVYFSWALRHSILHLLEKRRIHKIWKAYKTKTLCYVYYHRIFSECLSNVVRRRALLSNKRVQASHTNDPELFGLVLEQTVF